MGIMSFGNLPALCSGRYIPGGTDLAEMPKLKRRESGLSSDTHPCVSGRHLPHLCLLFVSCTVRKPLAPWGEAWLWYVHARLAPGWGIFLLSSSFCHVLYSSKHCGAVC